MNEEIERKYLVIGGAWRQAVSCRTSIRHGYLAVTDRCTVRVRTRNGIGYLTVKGARTGNTRQEFEYRIPIEDAAAMLDELCGPALVEKTRHEVRFGSLLLEVDEFHGQNSGLIIVEVELRCKDDMPRLPSWVGAEVTDDDRYYSAHLSRHPFNDW